MGESKLEKTYRKETGAEPTVMMAHVWAHTGAYVCWLEARVNEGRVPLGPAKEEGEDG